MGSVSRPADPGRFIESFVVESWAEHLRQHARATEADREQEGSCKGFPLSAVSAHATTHLIAEQIE
jgi:hypothetical protein